MLCTCVPGSRVLCGIAAFLFHDFGDAPFNESGTRSRKIRSRIGRQSVGRTLRGLLLSRRSLPFKPPPLCSLILLFPLIRSLSYFSPPFLPRESRPALARLSSFRPLLSFAPLGNWLPFLFRSHRWVNSRRLLQRAPR